MKRMRAERLIALGSMMLVTTASDCPTADPVSRCVVEDVSGFNANGLSASTSVPERCPVRVNLAGDWRPYEGVVRAPDGKANFTTMVSIFFYNARNEFTGDLYNDFYRAATAGFDQLSYEFFFFPAISGWRADPEGDLDYGMLTTELATGVRVDARARLPYTREIQAIVGGPTVVAPGTGVTLIGSTSANVTQPVAYRWYRDGSLVGSLQQYSATLTTTSTFTLVAISADARQGSTSHQVNVGAGVAGAEESRVSQKCGMREENRCVTVRSWCLARVRGRIPNSHRRAIRSVLGQSSTQMVAATEVAAGPPPS